MKNKYKLLADSFKWIVNRARVQGGMFLEAKSFELQANRGLTLIELLVVILIIIFISAAMMANINKFGGETLAQNLAYDIALSIREAQVYGVSVKGAGLGTFSAGYGVHFDVSSPSLALMYNLFADKDGNGVYTGSTEDVSPSPYSINRGFSLYKLCVPAGADVPSCTSVTKLDILFLRPEPDAYIQPTGCTVVNGNETCNPGAVSARIVVSSPRGNTMSIIITNNGQISVSGH